MHLSFMVQVRHRRRQRKKAANTDEVGGLGGSVQANNVSLLGFWG